MCQWVSHAGGGREGDRTAAVSTGEAGLSQSHQKISLQKEQRTTFSAAEMGSDLHPSAGDGSRESR